MSEQTQPETALQSLAEKLRTDAIAIFGEGQAERDIIEWFYGSLLAAAPAVKAEQELCEFHGDDSSACRKYSGKVPCEPAPVTPAAQGAVPEGWRELLRRARKFVEDWDDDSQEFMDLCGEIDNALAAAPAQPAVQAEENYSTTSDRYRADLYDEVWQLARDMGYGNVTMALEDLAAFRANAPAQPTQQGEAVEVVGWRRLDRTYELTSYPSVCAIWHGVGYPVQELYTHPAASVPAGCKVVPRELPPFAQKVISKLQRFEECASDSDAGGVDIGRHWLDLLTQLGLLNRVQRSPGLWEISQQGEDLLASAEGVKDE